MEETNSTYLSKEKQAKPQSIQNLTTTPNFRNTTESAHQETKLIAEGKSIRNSVYKFATVLWNAVVQKENTLKVFETADKVASSINKLCGIELLSGHELEQAIKNDNVGKSPPRRGKTSSVPDDEFKAFCVAVYTLSAIQQINSVNRSTRSELTSLVGQVLNDKREEEGLKTLGECHFFRRIEVENSRKQVLVSGDKRESIRVQWLTYLIQKKSFQRWEEMCVELGFARWPRDGEDIENPFLLILTQTDGLYLAVSVSYDKKT